MTKDFSGNPDPFNNPSMDVRAETGRGSEKVIGYPIKVERRLKSWMVYTYVPHAVKKFKVNDEFSEYGWIRLDSSNSDTFTIMGPSNLWLSVVEIDLPYSEEGFMREFLTTGVIRKDKNLMNDIDAAKSLPSQERDAKMTRIVTTGFSNYRTRVAKCPIRVELSYPSGKFRDAWAGTQAIPYEAKRESTKTEFNKLIEATKNATSIGERLRIPKEQVYLYGNMEMQDQEVTYKTSKGDVIDKKTPFVQWSGVKSVEYPNCKPASFKMSKMRFNKLADEAPSTILKPIRMFVESVGDVEEYAVGMIVGIWRMINVFQK